MTTNAPNKCKPLKMPKKASPAPPQMIRVPFLSIFKLHAEVKRLRIENENIKKGLPLWRKASGRDNVDDNTWCILYSRLYGIGIG